MMTRRERLMATLRGQAVDRPAVNLYEIGSRVVDTDDPNPFNIYNDPSWLPLLDLAEDQTDLIRLAVPAMIDSTCNRRDEFMTVESYTCESSIFVRTSIEVDGRILTSLSRRDPGIDTWWQVEHLLKDVDDLKAYLSLPEQFFSQEVDISHFVEMEEEIADRGIAMLDIGDPLCSAASLFSMEDYTIIALTEQELFTALLEKFSHQIYRTVEQVAKEFPGHLWRIYGPEYATEPYLPVRLFEEYVVRFTGPMVETIRRHGGFPRIHCHGRVRKVLPYIVDMGAVAIDPLEPYHQGDVDLAWVRKEYGRDLALFGNLEVADIESMETPEFEKVVRKSLEDGTSGKGRGFVLMPSAAPYGRKISDRVLSNYETMVRLATAFTN